MSNYSLLTSLLPLLAQFESEKKLVEPAAVEDFAVWLHDYTLRNKEFADKTITASSAPNTHPGGDKNVTLAKIVYYMYRYARFYTRKGLKDSMLNSLDEFSFLVTMVQLPSTTKTELIHKMVYDKTSGVELINRLIKQGLVAEAQNPADKRSKIISLTDAGRGVLFGCFNEMNKVASIIPGNLTGQELDTLIYLLDKLDHHHLHIWDTHKESDLDTILASPPKI